MFDFMDSQFRTRWILIISVCWILTFLHVGVDGEPNLEMTSTRLLGTSINFTCSYTGNNQFYASLFKDKNEIALIPTFGSDNNVSVQSPYANRITTSNGRLLPSNVYYYSVVLSKLQCADEGNYFCRVNIAGNIEETNKSLQVKANAHMPNLTAPTNFVVLGDTVTLSCTANVGKPARNLSLCVRHENGFNCSEASKLVDLGNCSYSQTATMTVNITEDVNQATCEVIPSNGNLKVNQNWQVQYPVLAIKLVPDDLVVTLMEGESKTIACEARGKPPPSYRWTFQPKVGAVDTNIWPKDQQNIYLGYVDISNMGIYTCVASNSIRNVTHNMTKSITINIVPTTPAPTTKITTTPVKTTSGTNGQTPKTGPQTNDEDDNWKLIVGIVCALLFLIILLIVVVIFYRRRSKPTEIEEPPEKPRNNHEVNMKETKPDLVYSTGLDKGKLPMYNTGFDHNGEDDLYYAELAFDDRPRSRKPVVPLYDNSSNSNPYTTVMPQV